MKLLKIGFLVFLLLTLTSTNVFAYYEQGANGGGGSITDWEDAVYGMPQEYNLQSHTNETFRNLSISISAAILGPTEKYSEIIGGGVVGTLGNLIAGMYTSPPVSSTEYFADLGGKLKVVKPVYAQGVGFEGLRSILDIWKIFRNITYLFFVIIFVVIGFAIMFRVKLNPQTVISIQNALPKIIIALILVTFSYAIAGLLIDLLYVATSLILTLLDSSLDYNQNVFKVAGGMLGIGTFEGITSTAAGQIKELVQSIFRGIEGPIFGFTADVLARVVFAIAIAFSLFKLFFTLLMSYISILLGVIFAPFMLMLSALPGQKGVSNWLKLMLSNIIPFPLTAAIFALTYKFVAITKDAPSGTTWLPPFLGIATKAYIPVLIGLGMILLAPQIVDGVKKAIGAPGIAGIAGALAPGVAPIKWGAQYRAQVAEEKHKAREEVGTPTKPHEHGERAFWNVLRTSGKVR
ncbi:MAG TPA: hypothetical protein VMX76_02615 [Nevskiaceae bacterium]|nr:hypothetical protein [Nevskiaceae bacterium]